MRRQWYAAMGDDENGQQPAIWGLGRSIESCLADAAIHAKGLLSDDAVLTVVRIGRRDYNDDKLGCTELPHVYCVEGNFTAKECRKVCLL